MSDRVELGGCREPGWHRAYRRGDELVVEWLEYRDPAPYDHATKIIFRGQQELALRETLELHDPADSTTSCLAERFHTYWAVRSFADAHEVAYESEVDFHP